MLHGKGSFGFLVVYIGIRSEEMFLLLIFFCVYGILSGSNWVPSILCRKEPSYKG